MSTVPLHSSGPTVCRISGVRVRRLKEFSFEGLPEANSLVVQRSSTVDPANSFGLRLLGADSKELIVLPISQTTESAVIRDGTMLFGPTPQHPESIVITIDDKEDFKKFKDTIVGIKSGKMQSIFEQRTEETSAVQYFQFYSFLSQQQNMLQDYIRTATYQRAIQMNDVDFRGKVVLDVGAGSGILSFFAYQVGARKVYAVEASSMAEHCAELVRQNKMSDVVEVVHGKIEEVILPESVDIIISEPMGYMLLNERMLETFLHAKKFLKPNGRMFPTIGDLHIAPFTDESLYMEQLSKANFWYQNSFHGIDLSGLREKAFEEYFRQPIVDTFDIRICPSTSVKWSLDFEKDKETDLYHIDIPLQFSLVSTGMIHGLAFWFDAAFVGSQHTIWLTTAPNQPLTHWYQVRCLLKTPLFAVKGQVLTGRVLMVANGKQSYDVTIDLAIEATGSRSSNTLDLKNPYFRYTGQPVEVPPGVNTTSPSDNYNVQIQQQQYQLCQSTANMQVGAGAAPYYHQNGPGNFYGNNNEAYNLAGGEYPVQMNYQTGGQGQVRGPSNTGPAYAPGPQLATSATPRYITQHPQQPQSAQAFGF